MESGRREANDVHVCQNLSNEVVERSLKPSEAGIDVCILECTGSKGERPCDGSTLLWVSCFRFRLLIGTRASTFKPEACLADD